LWLKYPLVSFQHFCLRRPRETFFGRYTFEAQSYFHHCPTFTGKRIVFETALQQLKETKTPLLGDLSG
jgi:hypothetical protein